MSQSKDNDNPINPLLVRQLADILKDTDLSEIEVEHGHLKIRVARQMAAAAAVSYVPAPAPVAAQAAPVAVPATAPEAAPTAKVSANAIKSPMVGTVYMQAQPGNPPFVKVGDTVKECQTLLIIEAMKTMNPLPSPRAGKVVEILVADSQPVEFGAPLIVIE